MATKKTITVDVWEADGLTFNLESQALDYEQRRRDSKIRDSFHTMNLLYNLNYIVATWILIRSEIELDYFVRNYGNPKGNKVIMTAEKKKLSLGDWVAVISREDEEGSSYEVGIITLECLLSEMQKFISKAEDKTVNGKY